MYHLQLACWCPLPEIKLHYGALTLQPPYWRNGGTMYGCRGEGRRRKEGRGEGAEGG